MGESKLPRSRDELHERDRTAWSLPRPSVGPVGPVREVWPVHETRESEPTPLFQEPPAAA
jgi:hypothetical protein